jgi:hypothetical protein
MNKSRRNSASADLPGLAAKEAVMSKASSTAIGAMAAAAWLSGAEPALAQDAAEQQFGRVHFPTSCNEVAQRRFDRAMRYQHSFWYTQSKELFEEALAADSSCAIAYWGIALSLLFNPHIQLRCTLLPTWA